MFELLTNHLVEIEDEREKALERYYPDATKDGEEFKEFISNYIKGIEGYIFNAKVATTAKKLVLLLLSKALWKCWIYTTVLWRKAHCFNRGMEAYFYRKHRS